ncbi:MAG: hypothetical protein EHM35_00660 [Planctomycetaceae bacterium]|nr:MAG: hypothetical protein EHM35_00660 [Planctomycetaceae bacterium]
MIRRYGGPGMCGVGGIPLANMGVSIGAGNGLLTNLIAYWPGNEANGNAQDAHTNALHLTDTNTVTSAAGIVYAGARQYTRANLESHVRAGDDALLSTGDVDFTLAAWVNADGLADYPTIASRWGVAPNLEYRLIYYNVPNRFQFYVSNNGTATNVVSADNLGIPAIATWYLLVAWHDSVANTINIQVNNGVANSVAHATGVYDSASPFRIATYVPGVTIALHWNGRIGPTAFWKSAAGGGGVLTATQRTALYNGGLGLAYTALTT